MPIAHGTPLERRKNEKEITLPDVTLSTDDGRRCADLIAGYMAHRASRADIEVVTRQLGRYPRGIVSVASRCRVCGTPLVVVTRPLLREGVRRPTPFPTTFYLTSPEAVKAVSRLEATGVMAELTARLEKAATAPDTVDPADAGLLRSMTRAHLLYCRVRADLADALGDDITHIRSVGVGGMPTRVKCLHSMVGQSLAMGPGANPIGELALERIHEAFSPDVCRCVLRVGDGQAPGRAVETDGSQD